MFYNFVSCFNREVKDYMNNKVDYVITNEDWDDNFEEVSWIF